MAIILNDDSKKKDVGGLILEDGIYKVTISQNEDKVEDFETSKKKGFSLHNLRFTFENNKSIFAKVYYQNEEGDIEPTGYNLLVALRKILLASLSEEKREKATSLDSNKILNTLIKNKVDFYVATRKNEYKGNTYTNINTYEDPVFTLEEAKELAKKTKLSIISLVPEEESADLDDYDDEDDDDL